MATQLPPGFEPIDPENLPTGFEPIEQQDQQPDPSVSPTAAAGLPAAPSGMVSDMETASQGLGGAGLKPIVAALKFLRDHPTISKMAGGVGGMMAGVPAGPLGMIGGAALGTAGADAYSQVAQAGTEEAPTSSGGALGRLAGAGAEGAVTGAMGGGTLAAAPRALRMLASPIGQAAVAGGGELYRSGNPLQALGAAGAQGLLGKTTGMAGAIATRGGAMAKRIEDAVARARASRSVGNLRASLMPAEVAPLAEPRIRPLGYNPNAPAQLDPPIQAPPPLPPSPARSLPPQRPEAITLEPELPGVVPYPEPPMPEIYPPRMPPSSMGRLAGYRDLPVQPDLPPIPRGGGGPPAAPPQAPPTAPPVAPPPAASALPPVAPGKVRLFRGEGDAAPNPNEFYPEHLAPSRERMGRWFTDSEQEAMGYGGNLRYVDVTPQEAQALKYGPMPGAEESASQFLVTPEVRTASQPRGHSAEWLAERNRKLGIKVPASTPQPASSDVHGELEQWMLEKRTAGALHDEARVAAQPKLSYKEALALEPGLSFGQRGPAGPSFPYSKETEDVAQLIKTLRAKFPKFTDEKIMAYVRNLRDTN